ncbi:MAG: tetratricopeptide repeat protein [Phycisphaerae bacterium]|nr:tetratricopeptide repeat protein [Phycisphaerae bacterium]
MRKRQVVIGVFLVGYLCYGLCGQEKPEQKKASPAEKAERVHRSAMSQYRAGEWRQAAGLLEKYIKGYPSHEYVPTAYMEMAYCWEQLKDFDKYEKALDEVIRRFGGSPAWYIAHGSKLARRKAIKDNDGYLTLLESMLRRSPEVPLFLHGGIGRQYGIYTRYEYYNRPFEPVAARIGRFNRGSGWALDIAQMADMPERAERALKILEKTFRLREKELPIHWQYAHVLLLKKAGKTELSETTFGKYLQTWGKDPHAIGLWLLKIADAKERGDDKTIKAGFEYLIKTWPGAGSKYCYHYVGPGFHCAVGQTSLALAVWQRLEDLYKQDRFVDYIKLARYYLKAHTAAGGSRSRGTVAHRCTYMALRKAGKGDNSGIHLTLKLIDDFFKDACPVVQRSIIVRRLELYNVLKEYNKASKLATELVGPKHWSAGSFAAVKRYADKSQAFEKIVASARTKWKIPTPNPSGKSAVLLTNLKTRIGDDQMRHAEEIAEEMFAKHRAEAETINAVKMMCDYYFTHVLPKPRDKWMDRMVKTYPYHPSTEAVLRNKITAEKASRKYDKVATTIDTLLNNFPGIDVGHTLYHSRRHCYDASKDYAGKVVFAKRIFGCRADAGEVNALSEVARVELSRYSRDKDNKAIGDYWLAKAKRLKGKCGQLYCLVRAWGAYFGLYSYYYNRPESRCQDGAKTVIGMMQGQDMDPELRWMMAFSDVNLLAYCDDGAGALKILNDRLSSKPAWRDLSLRLDLDALGRSLGKRKMHKAALLLATKLKKCCYTRRDKLAIEQMLASMYNAEEKYVKASKHYLKIVYGYPVPARMYPFFESAMRALRKAESPRYPAEMERYMKKISGAQDLVPGLMSQLGGFYLIKNISVANRYYKKLVKRYPASKGRETLGRAIEKRRK